jgi:hypothetical protein
LLGFCQGLFQYPTEKTLKIFTGKFTGRDFGERKIRTYFLHKSLWGNKLRAEGVEPTHPFGYKDLNISNRSGMSFNNAKNRVWESGTYQKLPYLGVDIHRIFTGTGFRIQILFNNIT